MSIINKMLQDLDDRSGRPGGEAVAGEAVRSIKPVSPWRNAGPTRLAHNSLNENQNAPCF